MPVPYDSKKTMWWGYLHHNGTAQLKRWFGDIDDYTTDVYDNPFVMQTVIPFEAATREEAMAYLRKQLYLPPA